jgi:alkanesulfonate monooxygenase SsuD/methylene tetrahydromethanopterin reductase-like flavin-dependent oxidoreductase (luciferase family)
LSGNWQSARLAILVAILRRRAIGYSGRMGFFDTPAPPPPRPIPQPPPPEWMAAPAQIDGALLRAPAAEAQQLWSPLTAEEQEAARRERLQRHR